jgi:hypothetical protein
MRIKKAGMARPKKFSERTVLAFPADTFAKIARLAHDGEDRSSFIRSAVELEIAVRSLDGYAGLKDVLTGKETVYDFCAKAVRRALTQRIAALADDRPEKSGSKGD